MITVGAQDSLSLYMAIAAKNNPVVLQKYYEYQAALQKVPQVGSLPDPEFSMGVFLSPMELVSGNQIADLRLMQMFPWFGTLKHARDEMSMMANAKYEALRDTKLQVFYEVQSNWYDLFKIKQNILISEKNIEILKTIERLALVKFRSANATGPIIQAMPGSSMGKSAGVSSLTDLYRVQIELSDLANNVALFKNQQTTLTAQFNNYLNRPVISAVSLPDSLSAEVLHVPLEAISDSMLLNNPMMDMLQYEQKSLVSRKKMVTRMGYPMIGLGVNYSVVSQAEMSISDMNGKDMIMPMVAFTLPVYRKKYHAMQAEADLLMNAAAQNYAASANNLKTEYYQAVQLYQDAQRRITLYASQGLLAGKSLEIMMKNFATSGADLTDLLRVQQQTLDFEYRKVEAVADFNKAVAWLNRLMAFQQIQ
jgi:outer membrane protein TolC